MIVKFIFKLFESFFYDSQKGLKSTRFDYLDGYRGFCAIVVTIHHLFQYYSDSADFSIFVMAGYFIGVYGFFVLSSFLLTYRLTKEFHSNSAKNFKCIFVIILNYIIRRFFRIYLPFVIFATMAKFGPSFIGGYVNYINYKKENNKNLFYNLLANIPKLLNGDNDSSFVKTDNYNSWIDLVLLRPVGINHLWTIPIEIKYYFIIPFICLVFYLSKKFWYLFLIGFSLFIFIIYNFILINIDPKDIDLATSDKIYPRLPVFFSGSIIAFIYFKYENNQNELIKKLCNNKIVKFIIEIASFILSIYGIKKYTTYFNSSLSINKDLNGPGICFSLLLFLMLIGSPNQFTFLFGDNYFLKKFGKFSFGVYLFHPMCILIKKIIIIKTRIELVSWVLFLSYLSGFLFYYLVENPFMKLGNYFINKIKDKKLNINI